MHVKLPGSSIQAALLGAGQNELIYRFDSFWFDPIETTIGPFSTPSSSGEVDFDVDVPAEDDIVLSVQINDATTHQPLAVGATGIDLVNFPSSDYEVDMGSVTRNCYYTQAPPMPNGGFYNFNSDILGTNLPTTEIADLQFSPVTSTAPAQIQDTQDAPASFYSDTVCYLGNGNLVDFDYLPDSFYFYPDSYDAKVSDGLTGDLQAGDIFCVLVNTIPSTLPPTTAWVQITNPGGGAGFLGPSFIFRTNTIYGYFAYEQTPIDLSSLGVCNMGW